MILCINPNRSLDRYSAIRYRENNFLPSSIFLLASCFLFVLDVARYAFELTTNHLLNNPMKSVQDLMTDLRIKQQHVSCVSKLFLSQKTRAIVHLLKEGFKSDSTISEKTPFCFVLLQEGGIV